VSCTTNPLDSWPSGYHPKTMHKPPADLLPISLLLFAGVFTAWIGIAGPLLADDVWTSFWKFVSLYQTLIGATIAAAGILVASRNVTRQLRQGVLAREEDRIERDLPGIRSANSLIGQLRWQLDNKVGPYGILKSLREQGLIAEETSVNIDLAKVIPDLPDQIRRELTNVLFSLRAAATNMLVYQKIVENSSSNVAPELRLHMQETLSNATEYYFASCNELIEFYDSMVRRIVRDRARLLYLRREHERWLHF
jgi:hypothetical protein